MILIPTFFVQVVCVFSGKTTPDGAVAAAAMSSPAAHGNYNGSNTVPGVACCTLARVGGPTCYIQCDIVTVLLHAMKMKMLRRMRCHGFNAGTVYGHGLRLVHKTVCAD